MVEWFTYSTIIINVVGIWISVFHDLPLQLSQQAYVITVTLKISKIQLK